MAAPNTRQTLSDYALRALGDDVVEINVSEDQLSDRLDDALQFYQDYHSEGIERVYLKHKVIATSITLTTATAASFSPAETIKGQTSLVEFTLDGIDGDSILLTKFLKGILVPGEVLLGLTSGFTANVGANGPDALVTVGDFDNRYLPLTDAIVGVNQVLPLNQNFGGSNFNMFDIRYQIMLNDMFSLTNINMLYYTQVQSHLSMINFFLNPAITFQFTRNQNKLTLNIDWEQKVNIGDWFVVEAMVIVSPDDWPKVYNDRILKEYYVALVKRQWGNNMKKFGNMVLPGGVVMNGQQIYDEAMGEIAEIRNRIVSAHQLPVDFLVG